MGLNPEYVRIRHLDPTVVKRFVSGRGEFISFITKGGHVFKDPIILLKRLLIKLATGQGDLAALGYYDLWAWNYNKGELLFSCFTEEEMAAHQITTRIMFNLKKEGVHVKPDFSKISSGVYVNENAETIVEQFDLGVLDYSLVEDVGLTSVTYANMAKVTIPFNIVGQIDFTQMAMMME